MIISKKTSAAPYRDAMMTFLRSMYYASFRIR